MILHITVLELPGIPVQVIHLFLWYFPFRPFKIYCIDGDPSINDFRLALFIDRVPEHVYLLAPGLY